MLRLLASAIFVQLVGGCFGSSPEPDRDDPLVECLELDACLEKCEDHARAMTNGARVPDYEAAACGPRDVFTGPPDEQVRVSLDVACVCEGGGGPLIVHGEASLGCIHLANIIHCAYEPGEFEGCEVGNAASCEPVCELIQSRVEELNRADIGNGVDVIGAECDADAADGSCACTFRYDDICFDLFRDRVPCDA